MNKYGHSSATSTLITLNKSVNTNTLCNGFTCGIFGNYGPTTQVSASASSRIVRNLKINKRRECKLSNARVDTIRGSQDGIHLRGTQASRPFLHQPLPRLLPDTNNCSQCQQLSYDGTQAMVNGAKPNGTMLVTFQVTRPLMTQPHRVNANTIMSNIGLNGRTTNMQPFVTSLIEAVTTTMLRATRVIGMMTSMIALGIGIAHERAIDINLQPSTVCRQEKVMNMTILYCCLGAIVPHYGAGARLKLVFPVL